MLKQKTQEVYGFFCCVSFVNHFLCNVILIISETLFLILLFFFSFFFFFWPFLSLPFIVSIKQSKLSLILVVFSFLSFASLIFLFF